jgi:hypothetical protein
LDLKCGLDVIPTFLQYIIGSPERKAPGEYTGLHSQPYRRKSHIRDGTELLVKKKRRARKFFFIEEKGKLHPFSSE